MASCVCSLRRLLHPSSTCVSTLPSIATRWEHVAAPQDSISGGVAKGPPSSGKVGPDDKRAEKKKATMPENVWSPDPNTGFYRPIDQAIEAREGATKRKN